MSETREVGVESTPWYLWVIGVVALVWSAMGALDYVMTQTRNETYMSEFTPEQLSFFTAFRPGQLRPGLLRFGVEYLARFCC